MSFSHLSILSKQGLDWDIGHPHCIIAACHATAAVLGYVSASQTQTTWFSADTYLVGVAVSHVVYC